MDETLKVLIGAFSGFIIAFLAEPIKIVFQTKAKRNNLRRALYHEMLSNYALIKRFLDEALAGDQSLGESGEKIDNFFSNLGEDTDFVIRLECFQNAVANENYVFYQLQEASLINMIYGRLTGITTWLKKEDSPQKRVRLEALLLDYFRQMEDGLSYKEFDPKIVEKITNRTPEQLLHQEVAQPARPVEPEPIQPLMG